MVESGWNALYLEVKGGYKVYLFSEACGVGVLVATQPARRVKGWLARTVNSVPATRPTDHNIFDNLYYFCPLRIFDNSCQHHDKARSQTRLESNFPAREKK